MSNEGARAVSSSHNSMLGVNNAAAPAVSSGHQSGASVRASGQWVGGVSLSEAHKATSAVSGGSVNQSGVHKPSGDAHKSQGSEAGSVSGGEGVAVSMTSEKMSSIMQYLEESDKQSHSGLTQPTHVSASRPASQAHSAASYNSQSQSAQRQSQQQSQQSLHSQQQGLQSEHSFQQLPQQPHSQQPQQQITAPPSQHAARRALWSPDHSQQRQSSAPTPSNHNNNNPFLRASNTQSLPHSARASHASSHAQQASPFVTGSASDAVGQEGFQVCVTVQ